MTLYELVREFIFLNPLSETNNYELVRVGWVWPEHKKYLNQTYRFEFECELVWICSNHWIPYKYRMVDLKLQVTAFVSVKHDIQGKDSLNFLKECEGQLLKFYVYKYTHPLNM